VDSRSRSRSRSRTIYFSNISQKKMNNLPQPSFTQHLSADPTEGTSIRGLEPSYGSHNFLGHICALTLCTGKLGKRSGRPTESQSPKHILIIFRLSSKMVELFRCFVSFVDAVQKFEVKDHLTSWCFELLCVFELDTRCSYFTGRRPYFVIKSISCELGLMHHDV
jgi:hypothetical protein